MPSRPIARPDSSVPSLGSRPGVGSLPGVGNRPDLGNRPALPARPGAGNFPGASDRPALTNRPATGLPRPGVGDRPPLANRPGINPLPGGAARPSPGNVGDFLGISRPLQPGGGGVASTLPARPGLGDRPASLPGLGDRPGLGTRPGLGDRPVLGDRPGLGGRPGSVGRPGVGDRPNLADRGEWARNPVINNRPAWANIDRSVNINVHNRWNNAFVNPGRAGWWNRPANRLAFWTGWGLGVRRGWGQFHRPSRWFAGTWWSRHRFPLGGWHFHFWNHNFPARYWWGVPTWARLTAWFTWSAPAAIWVQPVYYDYGPEGNVTYVNNNVYVGGEPVATAEEFATTAMDLATVAPPQSDEQAAAAEWMPLGTFAVSTSEKDVEPSHVVQLAVNKAGIISGTMYNIDTDQAQAVQGQVDKETQRVAFRLGESETVVAETGLYNLTQEEAPVLVHFGTVRTENYLLVRLQYTEEGEDAAANSEPTP